LIEQGVPLPSHPREVPLLKENENPVLLVHLLI